MSLADQGYATVKTHEHIESLRLLNYVTKTWELWRKPNELFDVSRALRGIVLDTNTRSIVARGYNKFFDIGQVPTFSEKRFRKRCRQYKPLVTEKLDGSCILLWFYDNEWHTSTLGTFHSDQAIYAKGLLDNYNLEKLDVCYTYVLELITPWDSGCKVVDYGSRDELVLIGIVNNTWNYCLQSFEFLETTCKITGFSRYNTYDIDADKLYESIPEGHEGFVVHFPDYTSWKVHSEWFLEMHKIAGATGIKNLLRYAKGVPIPDSGIRSRLRETVQQKVFELQEQFRELKAQFEHEHQQAISHITEQGEAAFKVLDKILMSQEYTAEFRPCHFMKVRGVCFDGYLWRIVERQWNE